MFLKETYMRISTNTLTSIPFILLFSSGAALCETVSGYELSEDKSGYPCFLDIQTDAGKKITLQLSDYKDVWSINFFVQGRASTYRQFFNTHGLHDGDAFTTAFPKISVGGTAFDLYEASLFVVQQSEVGEDTSGLFSISEQHNVAAALEAMNQDGLEITNLFELDGTLEAMSAFRACSYDAMGLESGERVETDFRAEYRMIFERSFESWVTSMSQAEQCLAGRFDDVAVEEVINAAADAFYPGIFNMMKRGSYRDDLEGKLPIAKLSGMADAKTNGCLMANRLAEMAKMPVDRAIEAAADLN
jgi:hypothetical protein